MSFDSRRKQFKKGLRPEYSLRILNRGEHFPYTETFPFRRNWVAIVALAIFDIIFTIPAFTTFHEARELWQQPDSLFSLVSALFITFWLLGWSMAPLLMTILLLVLVFGREEIRARAGELQVQLGLPFLGLCMTYRAASIRNLRIEQPPPKSGKAWRGSHAVFDYGAGRGEFGSDLAAEGLEQIRERIETFTGVKLRSGEARAEELKMQPEPVPLTPAPTPQEEPVSLASPSSLVLIGANIIPLAGAVFWSWDLSLLMLLYWAESAVIGFFNLCKIVVIGKWMALGAAPFFFAHFGGFMAVHFMFLYALFLGGDDSSMDDSLPEVAALFFSLWPALLALVISHGFSFFHNFLGRGEYRGRSMKEQMSEPYSRIVFMHLVIIFGGALSAMLGEPAPVIMGVIVLKTAIDLRAHLRQREAKKT